MMQTNQMNEMNGFHFWNNLIYDYNPPSFICCSLFCPSALPAVPLPFSIHLPHILLVFRQSNISSSMPPFPSSIRCLLSLPLPIYFVIPRFWPPSCPIFHDFFANPLPKGNIAFCIFWSKKELKFNVWIPKLIHLFLAFSEFSSHSLHFPSVRLHYFPQFQIFIVTFLQLWLQIWNFLIIFHCLK